MDCGTGLANGIVSGSVVGTVGEDDVGIIVDVEAAISGADAGEEACVRGACNILPG
jgi:uncharacterized protein YaiE (UPF0345 family)